jgi:hypothetical protein
LGIGIDNRCNGVIQIRLGVWRWLTKATFRRCRPFARCTRLVWSEALAAELEDTPMSVTALCPGATDTDFFPKAGMMATRAFQGIAPMAPQEVAKAGYEGLMRNELFVVPGGMNKALVAARRFLSEGAQPKLNEKFYEEIPVEDQKRERGDLERAAEKR